MSKIAFTACEFVYDNISSSEWGLSIVSMQGGEISGKNITTELSSVQIPRRSKSLVFGKKLNTNLSFQIKVMKTDNTPVDRFQVSEITSWLLRPKNPKRLFILQKDLYDTYYECVITEVENVEIGNQIYGFIFTVECNSPYAWQTEKTLLVGENTGIKTITFNNRSADFNLLRPVIKFETSIIGDSFYIKNLSNNDLTMEFTGLSANETITIDCDRKTIVSSTGLKRLSNFNKKYMELIYGANQLEIGGNITTMEMTYQFAKQVGE